MDQERANPPAEEEIQCFKDDSTNLHVVENIDACTQVNFLENAEQDCVVFVCIKYNNINTCDAELQESIPSKTESRKIIPKEIKTKKDTPVLHVTLETFHFLLDKIQAPRGKISKENQLLIMLMKMKCGLTFSALSVLFNVHRTTISRIFYNILGYLVIVCKNCVFWPDEEDVKATMPEVFKENYENCRVIIDCTEIKVEEPPSVEDRVNFYSHYKKGFTIKVLVGCTPSGCISFISKCMGGRTSDAQITCQSGLLDLLKPEDVVLADKGFPQIKTKLDESGKGVLLVRPPSLTDGHFSEDQIDETYRVAKVRIHIERIMQRIRIYPILNKLSVSMFPHCDNISFMCCVLVNLQPPILKDSDSRI